MTYHFFEDARRVPLAQAAILASSLAVLVGIAASVAPVTALVVAGSAILGLAVFQGGSFSLDHVLLPLIVLSVLAPPIPLRPGLPAIRLDTVLVLAAWGLFILGGFVGVSPLRVRSNPMLKWILLFGLSIAISIGFAALTMDYVPIARDFWELAKVLNYFLLLALAGSAHMSEDSLRRICLVSIGVFTASAMIAIAQYVNLLNINTLVSPYYTTTQLINLTGSARRVIGTTGNPNAFAAMMAMATSLALAGALSFKRSTTRAGCWCALAVLGLGAVLTSSRTGMLTLAVTSCVSVHLSCGRYASPFRWVRSAMVGGFVLAVALVPMLLFTPSHFLYRMTDALAPGTSTSLLARLEVWQAHWAIWRQSPLFGWGPAKGLISTNVDNEWLLILARYGLVGIAVISMLFFSLYLGVSRVRRDTPSREERVLPTAVQATVVGYVLYMVFAGVVHETQLMPLLLLFAGIVHARAATRLREVG